MVILPGRRCEYIGVDAYTKLLLHCDGADGSQTFTDAIGTHTPSAAGHAQLDTAQAKFGVSSILFDAAGDDYISIADHADWAFGAGDFTIDFWIRVTNVTGVAQLMVEQRADNDNYFWMYSGNNGTHMTLQGETGGSAFVNIGYVYPTLQLNKWIHVALVRTTTAMQLFIDGEKCAKDASPTEIGASSWPDIAAAITFNGSADNAGIKSGWMDEIRVSKGIARWSSNFTPPRFPYR